MKMTTRKEISTRVRDGSFSTPTDLLALSDYEFEQWCGETAKGARQEYEMDWLRTEIDLAERWVDGLEALVDSADTQLEHAEAKLQELFDKYDNRNDEDALDEALQLEEFQKSWKPKINTFRRKVNKTLRESRRNLKHLERDEAEKIGVLMDAITDHKEATLLEFGEGTSEDDSLWSILDS